MRTKKRVTTGDVYRILNDPEQQRQPSMKTVAAKLGVTIGSVFYHVEKIRKGWRPNRADDK